MTKGESGKLRVYFVLGETSGDNLAADLYDHLQERLQAATPSVTMQAMGLAGERMSRRGVKSLFDIEEIAVMGFSAVIKRLPTILKRINDVVKDIETRKPDLVIAVDSPDFTHRVAKKVRQSNPQIPIIGYVCPSVWAWRSSRATKMTAYMDHVLAILPFEPEFLKSLNGPPATYVGHPSVQHGLPSEHSAPPGNPPKLLLLPGSRKGEITRLMYILGKVVKILHERGNAIDYQLICAPRRDGMLREMVKDWPVQPELIIGDEAKARAFESADAALAASGTVTLELALYEVPMVATYELDVIAKRLRPYLDMWTASLPNLIADRVVVKEQFDEYAKPGNIARQLERLMIDSHERRAQMEAFELIRERMATDRPAGEIGAEAIISVIQDKGILG